jgi:L-threonylcarbamoyladenylate synthase
MSRISQSVAIQKLKTGEVVAIPTETVYGLAASIKHPKAVERIFALKNRPLDNPLIIHIAAKEQMTPFVGHLPPGFDQLTHRFWPGSLTIVLPVEEQKIPSLVRAGLPTAAFRWPEHPLTQAIIKQTGPLVMPSANLSGKPSGTCFEHIEEDFGSHFPILDGGRCERGVESTVIRFDGCWEIIRLGCLSGEMLREVLGYMPPVAKKGVKPVAPGQMYKHYAPNAKLHLKGHFEKDRIVVGFQNRLYPLAKKVFTFGHIENPLEVMQNLYRILRDLDREGVQEAFVDMDIPEEGLWCTIRERLQRAANND